MHVFLLTTITGNFNEALSLLFGENPNRSVQQWTQAFNDAGIQTQMLERGLNGIRIFAMASNISGVIGSAVAVGVLISFLG